MGLQTRSAQQAQTIAGLQHALAGALQFAEEQTATSAREARELAGVARELSQRAGEAAGIKAAAAEEAKAQHAELVRLQDCADRCVFVRGVVEIDRMHSCWGVYLSPRRSSSPVTACRMQQAKALLGQFSTQQQATSAALSSEVATRRAVESALHLLQVKQSKLLAQLQSFEAQDRLRQGHETRLLVCPCWLAECQYMFHPPRVQHK